VWPGGAGLGHPLGRELAGGIACLPRRAHGCRGRCGHRLGFLRFTSCSHGSPEPLGHADAFPVHSGL